MRSTFLLTALALLTGIASAAPAPAALPLVESNKLRRLLTRTGLLAHASALQQIADTDPQGNRAFGGVGHKGTVEYIKRWFAQWPDYYTVETQDFNATYSAGSSSLSAEGRAVDSIWFTYSPSGTINAALAPVANLGCEPSDFSENVRGKIALISRGVCEFGLKVAHAGAAGATGAIIYNNVPGPIGGGTLGSLTRPEGPYVPVASISQEEGQQLLADATAGTVTGALTVFSVTEDRLTTNVFATTKGGDQNNIVQVGSHSDSVPEGPGLNDDGSGVMAQLEVAKYLTGFSVNNAVKFSFWSAEEFGLLGSEYFVSQLTPAEADKIRVYLNYDMIASPNYVYFVYDGDGSAFGQVGPPGSSEIESLLVSYLADVGEVATPTAFDGRSDYGPFIAVGIPSGGIFTGAEGIKTPIQVERYGGVAGQQYDPFYHQRGDTFKNLNMGAFITNTKGVAHSVAEYARSLSSIPVRAPTTKKHKKRDVHAGHVHATGDVSACGHKVPAI